MWGIIFAIVVASVVTWLVSWALSHKIAIKWFEWLLAAIGLVFLGAAFQHTLGEAYEGLYKAAWLGLLIMGGIGVVLIAVTIQSIRRRNNSQNG
ncbi:Tetrachloroethene reductive dehalogenase TceA membrane-bound subunit [Dehalococcoides mccartyi]|jgi:high-affinity Fe2+/Pb2+ permease|uniref:Putative anchoring protein KB1rdhB16 n=2 Tax=Dehalococcoides mccartyi TaxID=61435 RepID=A0A0A7NUX6_9CHLR|nr:MULTISPECIES: hypothetical protein [Dehalococcoides]AGG06959.1 putative reductive dehalogenase anchoring protein [Dehalococcoides mccartyi DCMB5]AIZ97090.1 putative anchoring protein KB1rdhB16 [Dehalococcoides mccartyi]RAL68901.1 Tetrachloroethene reductive dehalogenase TceA membrane-bound subunit [Dehalococcoides mccartyi]RAL70085.1 Tetrachloroethene reductive dehalogenase TceA membrane-bound subunit [Dehalococcoides mccartyi]BAS32399.1 reductive dehalogenase anchoring protein [Dehalococco